MGNQDENGRDKDRAWREWMMVSVGLTGLLSIVGTIVAVVALASTNPSRENVTVAATPAAQVAAIAQPAPQSLKILVKADDEHGRLGPDHQWHDAFLPADFAVHAGATVTITFYNYDSGPHTFTAPSMNVNQVIPGGGSLGAPKVVTLTFTAPSKPGTYQWWCSVPCDPWAMSHDGYMRGHVTVLA